jgi:hypothetical protein
VILIAKRTGRVRIGGTPRMIRKGITTAHAEADIVRSHPHLWGPLKVDYAGPDTEVLEGEAPDVALARLETFLVLEGPDGRPEDEGPVDTAIRLLRGLLEPPTDLDPADEAASAPDPDPAPAKPRKSSRAKAATE